MKNASLLPSKEELSRQILDAVKRLQFKTKMLEAQMSGGGN